MAALAAFTVYLRLASTRAVNSDGASIALAGWDMLHGNVLLRGWKLADVTFYTTEVPQYALIELFRGLSQNVIHIGAAMTYTLVLLFVAVLAKGTATGWAAAARVAIAVGIMLAPQLASGTDVLLSSPDHFGTSVPLLLILLILDRVRRPRWWVPVIVSVLVAWAELADSVVLLALVIPLGVVCAFRVARSRQRLAARWYEIALAAAAIAGFALAQVAYWAIGQAGGYTERPLGTQLAPLHEIFFHNLPIAAQCLLLLPGADVIGLPAGASTLFVALHLVGVAAAAAAIGLAAWRFGRREADFVDQLLLAGIVVNFVGFVVTTHVFFVASAREIAPVLPFAAVLAGRQLGPYFGSAGVLTDPGLPNPGLPPGGGRRARPRAGRVPGRARPRAHRADRAAAGRAADRVAGEPPDRDRPGQLLGGQRGDGDQRRPGRRTADVDRRQPDPPLGRPDQGRVVRPGPLPGGFRGAVPRYQGVPRVHRPAAGRRHLRQAQPRLPRRAVHDPLVAQEPADRYSA